MNGNTAEKIDAVILAGTHRNKKRLILDRNKAFLEIQGKTLVARVAEACLQCSRLGKVVVVGPKNALESSLSKLSDDYPGKLLIVQQRSRMLENVWNGFLATFDDGNNLPVNRRIESMLLGGLYPIKRRVHLNISFAVYSAVAGFMARNKQDVLDKKTVFSTMERRFNEFRIRFERQERFMKRMNVETLLAEGLILMETDEGIRFRDQMLYEFFVEWEMRFNKKIFITSCDIPFITPDAITDFLDRSDNISGDFLMGVASEELLRRFYTDKNGDKGIQRPYLSLREAHIRANNMILVRPNRVGNKELIQESFGIRKMTEWRNILALLWKLLRLSSRFQTVRMSVLLQSVAVLRKYGFLNVADKLRRRIRTADFEQLLSRVFMTGLRLVETPYSGVSLDIDSEEDYRKLVENFDYWAGVQEEIARSYRMAPVQDDVLIGIFTDSYEDRVVPSGESSTVSTRQ